MKQFIFQVLGLLVVIIVGMWVTLTPGALGGFSLMPQITGGSGDNTGLENQDNSSININLGGNGIGNNNSGNSSSSSFSTKDIKIVGSDGSTKATLSVEVADTADKRSKGLGGRSGLPADNGMLFVFDSETKPQFWMQGMEIPLDIIWIKNNEVVDMIVNIKPVAPGTPQSEIPQYSPIVKIDKALEVNAGYVSSHNINVGDKIYLASQ